MTTPIKEAIVLLQLAREKLEQELHHRGAPYTTKLEPDVQDLADVVEDIEPILCVLESFSDRE